MKLLMLQRLARVPDTLNEYINTGGLYLNVDHISELIPEGEHRTLIRMSNGTLHLTPNPILFILEDIARLNCSA